MKKATRSLFSWKPISISPLRLSQYPKRNKREWKLIDKKPFGDRDGDRVPNFFDCKPLNKKKQSYMFRKQIEKDVMSPERIVTTPSGKTLHVNFPTKKELIEEIKFHHAEGKSTPPKRRRRIISKKDVIRQIEKNPEFYSKLKKAGTKVELKNEYDAVFSLIGDNERTLATYRPGYGTIAVNPIRDINDPALSTVLKHELVHAEQDMSEGPGTGDWRIHEQEREAYAKMKEPTERQKAKLAGEKPETLSALPANLDTEKKWYYGTKLNKWYHKYPSQLPEYKQSEGLTDKEFKELGKEKAKEKVLSPPLVIDDWNEAKDFAHTLKHAEEITGYDTGVERHIAVKGYKFNPETGGYEEGD